MAKRFTDTEKYKKKFIRSLPVAYKLFWDYLYHDCNFAGIWYVDFEIAQIQIGKDAPINEKEALKLFNEDEIRVVVLDEGKKWFLKSFVNFQYGELTPTNKLHLGVIRELKKSGVSIPLKCPLQGAKDKDKDKDKRNIFIPPTLEELIEYCRERKNEVDVEQFFNFYESKGWKVGNQKMKDWRAAVRTWEKRKSENKTPISQITAATEIDL